MTKARDISSLIGSSGQIENNKITLDANEIPNLDAGKITSGTFVDARMPSTVLNSNVSVPNQSAFKNIIINGDMSIAQRGTSSSGITSSGYYTIDRWQTGISLGTWTQSQNTDVPSGQGFAKSLKMDCTTANASPSAGNSLVLATSFEGQMLQYLKKGTANAESLTLSFWVKSNKTGTYIAQFYDHDNNRSISKSYTIDVSNTWEKKTITYAGDTTGVFGNDTNASLTLQLWLGAGSNYTSGTLQTSWDSYTASNVAVGQVNLADSTANEWYITGVQLEAGTSASDFEFLPYDVNLQRCYRYYFTHLLGYQGGYGKKAGIGSIFAFLESGFYPVTMRASASISSGTPTFENCSNITFNSFEGKNYLCRVTSDNTSPYRAYETTVVHNAEL